MASTGKDSRTARVTIPRQLALHDSCRRLRQLHPQYPRTYGVAVLAEVSKRRWFPLDSVFTIERLRGSLNATAVMTERRAAGNMLAARLIHDVLGRLLPLVLLEGRAWDAGLENLWVHFDNDNDIDWVAVVDPTMRVLPDDPWISANGGPGEADSVLILPNESALTTWVAHRCHRTLAPLFVWLHRACEGAIPISSMWQLVGSTVVAAASQLPRRPDLDEADSFRRSQAVIDAMVGFGLPVRGPVVPVRQPTATRRIPAGAASGRGGGSR